MIEYHPPRKTGENRLGKAPMSLPQVTKASCHFLSGQFPETDEYHTHTHKSPGSSIVYSIANKNT